MLSDGASPVEMRVLEIVAETSGLSSREILLAASSAVDWPLDSLSSIAIVTRLEAIFEVRLGDAALALLVARDVRGLGHLIEQLLAGQRANLGEVTRKESC